MRELKGGNFLDYPPLIKYDITKTLQVANAIAIKAVSFSSVPVLKNILK
jgi:hypothetical protein